jgi:hypothetical protein
MKEVKKMLKKILNLLREKGLRGLFIATINFFLTKLFGLFIIKVESIAGNAVARKIFFKLLICSGYKQCYKSNVIQDW